MRLVSIPSQFRSMKMVDASKEIKEVCPESQSLLNSGQWKYLERGVTKHSVPVSIPSQFRSMKIAMLSKQSSHEYVGVSIPSQFRSMKIWKEKSRSWQANSLSQSLLNSGQWKSTYYKVTIDGITMSQSLLNSGQWKCKSKWNIPWESRSQSLLNSGQWKSRHPFLQLFR